MLWAFWVVPNSSFVVYILFEMRRNNTWVLYSRDALEENSEIGVYISIVPRLGQSYGVSSVEVSGQQEVQNVREGIFGVDNKIIPVAFTMVESENNDSWMWFLTLVRTRVVGNRERVCIISYRNKGLLHVLDVLHDSTNNLIAWPDVEIK
uniref:Uncharacterized protein n=1 Tax=Arundo donax TaxID=35708 RepID=A0A0A9EYM6_ARUDO